MVLLVLRQVFQLFIVETKSGRETTGSVISLLHRCFTSGNG